MFDLVKFRRDMHRQPETGFDVHATAGRLAVALENAGLDVVQGVGQSGLVATLRRGDGSGAIGLRADMDALPIAEQTNFSHRSTIEGKFHGCGHDGHCAMLLGAALELANNASLQRTVHFIFQPDEENGNGAQAMISEGLFERFPMDAIFGMHNMPGMALGQFATQAGPFCAFEDNFKITVSGRGGHSSMPEIGVDPIVAGAAIVTQLQTIVARNIPARDHAVISVTEFKTDGARNILASNVEISGDCRGFSAQISSEIRQALARIAKGVAAAHGAEAVVEYSTSFVPLVNDPACVEHAVLAAGQVGKADADYGTVGFSEDFAAFLEHRPGAFVLMGNGGDGAHGMPLHNPQYDFNDAAIPVGVAYWKALALGAQIT